MAKINDRGETNGASLVKNLIYVINEAQNFVHNPKYNNLIALKNGKKAGQWRDSDFGLGGGIYPYDINAIFVPSALKAIDDLYQSGALKPYLNQESLVKIKRAKFSQRIWLSLIHI